MKYPALIVIIVLELMLFVAIFNGVIEMKKKLDIKIEECQYESQKNCILGGGSVSYTDNYEYKECNFNTKQW